MQIFLPAFILFVLVLLCGALLIQATLIVQWKNRALAAEAKLKSPTLLLTQHATRIDVRV